MTHFVYLNLVKLGELYMIVGGAELLNLGNCAGCLLTELVAREIQNLKSLLIILLVNLLQVLVLRRESATGGGVYNQQHLSFVPLWSDFFSEKILLN